ncbi:hypothetical protein J6590_082485 [Homalodisca vitripennis]|nr:hypothetical protein J6590_082485 [Homalodisca vitripennis]
MCRHTVHGDVTALAGFALTTLCGRQGRSLDIGPHSGGGKKNDEVNRRRGERKRIRERRIHGGKGRKRRERGGRVGRNCDGEGIQWDREGIAKTGRARRSDVAGEKRRGEVFRRIYYIYYSPQGRVEHIYNVVYRFNYVVPIQTAILKIQPPRSPDTGPRHQSIVKVNIRVLLMSSPCYNNLAYNRDRVHGLAGRQI